MAQHTHRRVNFLEDAFTNRDLFGVVRGACTECHCCGGYWKATADYTLSAAQGSTQGRKHSDNDVTIMNCTRCGCPPEAHLLHVAENEREAGNDAFRNGDHAGALRHYSRALQEQPSNAVLWSNRAAVYLAMFWNPQALHDAEHAISLRPDWVKPWARKAAAHERMAELDAAAAAYSKCMELDAANASVFRAALAKIERRAL
ncbi:hypothetical protein WJX72_002355 [[Myrmecia] bisecta]|uniref:Uncharacterized protein n=1 Tax=[Myrmecia] bisecta TaxID=41462 RepID=A0AAW1PJJ8_9CHLO